MKIAIASGKGGTGKTTLSVALAYAAEQEVQYLDCDVEAPNGNLFLRPEVELSEDVNLLFPEVNTELCDDCRECTEICQFNAIVSQGSYAMVFPELCHSCGGCARVCPVGAITEVPHAVGRLEKGWAGAIEYVQGRLNIGSTLAPPVIQAVKAYVDPQKLTIIDSPPGTSCPMLTTVRDADFVLLVTEPTPFGLHDLKLAVETARELGLQFAVVINRADAGDDGVEAYCRDEEIEVMLRIPENRDAAQACSRGETILTVFPELKPMLVDMLKTIEERVAGSLVC